MDRQKTAMVLTAVPCSEYEQAFKTGQRYKEEYENMKRINGLIEF